MKIKLAIFDLAGTTVKDNGDVERILDGALIDFGVNASKEDVNAVMGIPKPVAIRQLLSKYSTSPTPEFVKEVHTVFVQSMMDFYRKDPSVKEHDGVSEVFSILKNNGIKVGIDTGFDRSIAGALLERLGWAGDDLVDYSVTSDEVDRGRPHPDMIHRLMQLSGIDDPARVVKIGDTVSDLREGNAAGCAFVVGVTHGAGDRITLEREVHTHLIENIPELLNVLGLREG